MPSYPLHALVLAKTKLGDSDLIFTLLAEDGSQVRAVAKGVRKPRSRLRGTLEVFSEVSLLCATGRNLDIITEAELLDAHVGCRTDYERTCAGDVVCEALRRLTLPDRPQRNLFAMSLVAVETLSACPLTSIELIVSAYLMKLVSLLGYRPVVDGCALCGGSIETDSDTVPFSIEAGGCLCDGCRNPSQSGTIPRSIVDWMAALVRTTFSDLVDSTPSEDISRQLLELSLRWLEVHTSTRLKSSSYLMHG
jgi:DNA repair protein RecO (recombination protein O)